LIESWHIRTITIKTAKPILLLLLVFIISTCIDPFDPNLKGREALLAVDGLLTNENHSYTVKLSKTTPFQIDELVMVSGAFLTITDQNGIESRLSEVASGIYKTDSLSFKGEAGNTYTLYIRTKEGTEYRSDPSTMYAVHPIDSIFYLKDQEFINNNTEILEGIRIFLNSENTGGGMYFRWIYDEWWKFDIPNPKMYNYIDQNNIPKVDTLKKVCFTHHGSDEIIIHSGESTVTNRIEKEPILFVASDQSDRLLKQYCINIKQLSLSLPEFQFWEQLKETNEGGGDIFDKQPFSISGNIHNISNPGESVLGYFQVSAVEEKRIYILPSDLKPFNLPLYSYDCERVEVGLGDYSYLKSFDEIYEIYTHNGYMFTEPIYNLMMGLTKLAFTRPACALCTEKGSLSPPDFWIEKELSQGGK
jgi:hypothetical protein